jgi:hypothetical protein
METSNRTYISDKITSNDYYNCEETKISEIRIINSDIEEKYLIIFCHPVIDYLVSTDIISQYRFFDRTREIFKTKNIIVKYFYEFLDKSEQDKYSDIYENYSMSVSDLIKCYKYDCHKIIDIISLDKIYKNSFIVGLEPIGFDIIFSSINYNNIKKNNLVFILSIYDPHGFFTAANPNYTLDDFFNIDKHKNIIDHRLDKCDLIITPSVKYFHNIQSKYIEKCRNIAFSYNNQNIKLIESNTKFNKYKERKHKILLMGAVSKYVYRRVICNIYTNTNNIDVLNNVTIKSGNLIDFREIIEILPSKLYNRSNTKPEENRGMKFIETLSEYYATFLLFGTYPIDFPLAKIVECFLSGALVIIEPKEFLYKDYGLIEFEHYIPLLIDSDEKLIIDCDYYKKYLGTDEGLRIAKNGYNHIINNFSDNQVAIQYINILKEYNKF